MTCSKCKVEFPPSSACEAGISIFVDGDEYIYSYWKCKACGFYTVESFHDRFLGETEITILPPQPQAVGDLAVSLIGRCPDPFNKDCKCESHRKLFYGVPRET